jgi:hypothetical protein
LGSEVALGAIPERVDRQHFHIDRHCINGFEALIDIDERLIGALDTPG